MPQRTPGTRHREPGQRARLAAVLLVAGLVPAACGTAASTGNSKRGQATGSPSVRAREQAVHRQVLASLHGPAPKHVRPGVASFIPPDATKVNRLVTATAAHPQLAIQGASVRLDLPGGETLATMRGPLFNNKYEGTNAPTVPAAFVLTFRRTQGTIPLAPDDFTVVDQMGNDIVPRIRVRGGGPLPASVRSGQRLTLVLSAIISAGDGSIVYDPTGIVKPGHVPLVGWDFIVEDD